MICYADTSFLLAWFHPADQFAVPVTDWARTHVTEFVWNPFLRAEIRHNLRLLKTRYARTAWNAYRASETMRKLIMDRRPMAEFLKAGDDLSTEKADQFSAGTWDYLHVAAFLESSARCFATLDKVQAELVASMTSPNRVKLIS